MKIIILKYKNIKILVKFQKVYLPLKDASWQFD